MNFSDDRLAPGILRTGDFPHGSGEMAGLIATLDWAATPIGPIATWPQTLRTTVDLLLQSPVPMVLLWGADGVMIYNDAYAEFAGARHPDPLGARVADGWPEVAEFNANVMRVGLAGGKLSYKDQELTLYRSGAAEQVFLNLDYSPVLDETGRPAGIVAIVIETTERVRAERERAEAYALLRQERDRAHDVLENMGEAFGLLDRDFRLVTVNAQTLRMEGVAREDLVGRTHWDIWPGSEHSELGQLYRHAMATGQPVSLEHSFTWPDGRQAWLYVNAYPTTDGLALFYRDITHRKQAADTLARSERQLRDLNANLERQVIERSSQRAQLWRVSPDLLSIVGRDGRFQATNPAWQRVLGWPSEALHGASWEVFVHPDDLPGSLALFAKMKQGEPVLGFENRYRAQDGSFQWLSWVAVPEGDEFYCSARNVTFEKAQAAELAAAQEALRQSQKTEAVGRLTGGIAHDFNNLLAGISGSLELAEARLAQNRIAEIQRHINVAQGAARRAAALTQRLLAFSRRQTLDPKPTDVNRLVAGMEDLIRRAIGPELDLKIGGTDDLWPTRVDSSQLENALLNLVINARDAMPDGGRITVETDNTTLGEREARERDVSPGDYITICVIDTGIGMTPDIVSRAFDPFFTTKPLGQGTGLGLSMIHGFVRQSGGQVHITSEPGHGTTICLYLPRSAEAASAEIHTGKPEQDEPAQGETVLVIDDEPTVRMLIVEVLEDAGYRALEAPDGPAGLRILQTDQRIDLLITDVGLPGGMNGRQVADAARVSRPTLKVLFVTGYAENAVLGNGGLEPGMTVITKPFSMVALAQKIRGIIDG